MDRALMRKRTHAKGLRATGLQKPTRLFVFYSAQLALRLVVFLAGITLLLLDSTQLDITMNLGLAHGFDFTDAVFLLMVADLASKLRPKACIAMGSRKQYREFHVPTFRLFGGGIKELRAHALRLLEQVPSLIRQAGADTRQAVRETRQGVREAGQQLAYSVDVLRMPPWPEEDLTASERLRASIRADRLREVMPVTIFWVVFNVAVGLLLKRFRLLNQRIVLLWSLFYFVFDMVSVVLWCPLQLALMRNRCCTTCQIFNWDGIMTVTPLLLVPCAFSVLLILGALVVLARWELAFARHPERFDERTNASLSCANCHDKLCYLRKPFTPRRLA